MKGMTLGQYYPADSVLHRMDPRIKILCTIAFIVASFLCVNFFAFILLVASAVALIFLSRIPLKVILRSVRPLIFIMAFTAVLNIFWVTDPGADPLFHWHFIKIYEKGLYHALFILLRIVAMVIGTSLFLTYTTSPHCTDRCHRAAAVSACQAARAGTHLCHDDDHSPAVYSDHRG